MARRAERPGLHLMLGQDVIYLLMTVFAVVALVLTMYVFDQDRQIAEHKRTIAGLHTAIAEKDRRIAAQFGLMSERDRRIRDLGTELDRLKGVLMASPDRAAHERLLRENERLNREVASLSGQLASLRTTTPNAVTDKPPIITLSDASGYSFDLGDASLSQGFRDRLRDEIIQRLHDLGKLHRAEIIEVIGHTDTVNMPTRTSTLDTQLGPFLRRQARARDLVATDNVGLGMARAAAVAQFLMADPRLDGFRVLPMSGGQLINTDETLVTVAGEKDARERRRIELRLRRANQP